MTSPEGFSAIETEVQHHAPETIGQTAIEATVMIEPEIIQVVYDLGGDDDGIDDGLIEEIDLADIDAVTTQDMLAFMGIEVSLDFCKKLAPIAGNHHRLQEIVEETNYPLELLLSEPWLAKKDAPNDFPFDQPESMKTFWTANHAYEKLDDEWSKGPVGKIIRTRLKNEIDDSLHDASQWLNAFKTPARHEKLNRDGQLGEVILHDHDAEYELLWQIVTATDEERAHMSLPTKPHRVRALFHDVWHRYLYITLTERIKAGQSISNDAMQQAIKENAVAYSDEHERTRGMGGHFSAEKLQTIASGVMNAMSGPEQMIDPPDETRPVSQLIGMLSEYALHRKEYVEDATTWLTRHMTSPSKRLTKVWGDRQLGLSEGTEDTAKALELWQKANSVRIYLGKIPDDEWKVRYSMTKNDVSGKFGYVTQELLRHYDAKTTVDAISRHWVTAWINKYRPPLLPPAVIPVEMNGLSYTAEILEKDDPKGMTIGPDTGCCMTLVGASRTCLHDGYDNPNAGFFALYNNEEKIMAQSYFYVNPNHPNVLVIDNIEANAGRDVGRIIKLYQRALAKYLDDRTANDSGWRIDTIQLGTGIGERVKAEALRLPSAPIILHPDLEKLSPEELATFNPDAHDFTMAGWKHIYSDATKDQRLLYVRGQELAGDYQVFDSKTRPREVTSVQMIAADTVPEEAIAEMEERIYPAHFRTYDQLPQLRDDLSEIASSFFSLVIEASANDGTKDFRGYSIAYLTDSIVEPAGRDTTLYVADVAIVPELQGEQYGAMLMKEILHRADAAGINNIEMHARESTTYQILKNSTEAKYVLEKYGYVLNEPDVINDIIVDLDNGVRDGRRLVALKKTL